MSITTVCAGIVAIVNALPAVAVGATSYTLRAVDPPPEKFDTAELPGVYVLSGPAAYDWASAGSDGGYETRQYRVGVAIEASGQSISPKVEARGRVFIPVLRDAFASYPLLGTASVRNSQVVSDTGVGFLSAYDNNLIGFEIILSVEEYVQRTYATNE